MVKKDSPTILNKDYLLIILPEFYKIHLKDKLTLAEYILLKIMIIMLQSIKKVSLEALATALPIPIKFESRKRKIQRFLSLPNLTIEEIWFPIVKKFLETYFADEKLIYVVMDYTENPLCLMLSNVSPTVSLSTPDPPKFFALKV